MTVILSPYDDILDLDQFQDSEQNLKDGIHERLNGRCEYDPQTACWIYTGCWLANGQARVRVGHRVYNLVRVAAWLYREGFRLWDGRWPYRICGTPACFNPEHIEIAAGLNEAMADLRSCGRWGQGVRVLNAAKVREILLEQHLPEVTLMKKFGVSRQAIRSILSGTSWEGVRRELAIRGGPR